jgi:hypothetical protein
MSRNAKIILMFATVSAGCLLPIAILVSSIAANYGLAFHTFEAEWYIPHYLSDKTLLWKIFYYPVTDGYLRSRQLSALFHWADTHILLLSAKAGLPHFLSIVHYALISLLVFFGVRIGYRKLGLRSLLISIPASCAFLLTPAIYYSGMYFRPSKILSGFLIGSLMLHVWSRQGKTWRHGDSLWVFVLAVSAALADEMGAVYVGLVGSYQLLRWLEGRSRDNLLQLVALVTGIFGYGAWRLWLSPGLTQRIIGADPDLSAVVPMVGTRISVAEATGILAGQLENIFGGIPAYLLVLPVSVLWFCQYRLYPQPPMKSLIRSGLLAGCFILVLISVYQVMAATLSVITWPEWSIIYYPIPLTVFMFLILTILMAETVRKKPNSYPFLVACTMLWAVSNAVSVNGYATILLDSNTKTSVNYHVAWVQISAMKFPKIPLENFWPTELKGAKAIRERMGY